MRLRIGLAVATICLAWLAAPGAGTGGEAETVLPAPVLRLADLDRGVKPDQDFFAFANGGWLKANPIPDEYPKWDTDAVLIKRIQQLVRGLQEEAAAKVGAAPGSEEQKIGDFYASGMNEKGIAAAGIAPLQPELQRIAAIRDRAELQRVIARQQLLGSNAVFRFGPMQDYKDSTRVIGDASQGGLGLPDRDYYLNDDAKSKEIRAAYVRHVAAMLALLGDSTATATTEAATVMRLETALAQASMPLAEQREPEHIYHPLGLAQLATLTPDLAWPAYFERMGLPGLKRINVEEPDFFKAAGRLLAGRPLAEWRTYLRWHLIDAAAPYLSDPFVNEDFKFSAVLTGAKKIKPRWQRVTEAEDEAIGFAVGKIFVSRYFPPASKAAVTRILHDIKAALKDDLEHLEWMSPATRAQAVAKLARIDEKIGYPEKWRDYSGLQIDRGPYVLNVQRASLFEMRRQLAKIGKPVDRGDWDMTPQTDNAYYDSSKNEIVFPAGDLLPPFFDPAMPAAVNYGSIGYVMGHEITHGFDDEGCQFDGEGNLKNWWTPEDLKKFQAAAARVADQFSSYTVAGGVHLQGKLVAGEAIADLGGAKLAWRAYQAARRGPEVPTAAREFAGFTPDQLFFLGFAHVWAGSFRDEAARKQALINPHPHNQFRVNGTLVNLPEFQKAFNIPAGSPMVNGKPIVVW